MILYAKLKADRPGLYRTKIEALVLKLKNKERMIVEWDESSWSYGKNDILMTAKGVHEWDGRNENYLNNMLPYIREELISIEEPYGFDEEGNAVDVKLEEIEIDDNGSYWNWKNA